MWGPKGKIYKANPLLFWKFSNVGLRAAQQAERLDEKGSSGFTSCQRRVIAQSLNYSPPRVSVQFFVCMSRENSNKNYLKS